MAEEGARDGDEAEGEGLLPEMTFQAPHAGDGVERVPLRGDITCAPLVATPFVVPELGIEPLPPPEMGVGGEDIGT